MKKQLIASVVLSALLAACGNFAPLSEQNHKALAVAVKDANDTRPPPSIVRVINEGQVLPQAHEVEAADPSNSITLKAQHQSFYALIDAIAGARGYSLTAMDGVDIARSVTVDLRGLTFDSAIRRIAMLAGYCIVVNQDSRTITFAKEAEYTFKVPPNQLRKISSDFNVGGNPTSTSGSGGGGGSSGGSSGSSSGGGSTGGADLQASFKISGKVENNPRGLEVFLTSIAGDNAKVQIFDEDGYITVRGNATALDRVHTFLQKYSSDARTQVQVQWSVVEVTANDSLQYGINWKKVLDAAGTKGVALNTTTATTASSGITGNITTASVTAIIQALETFAKLKVSEQPTMMLTNHSSATRFDGTQIPYLPSIQNQTQGIASTSTTTATAAYALDGISLSMSADILDSNSVALTLVPVSNTVQTFQSFLNGQISAPQQGTRQEFMQVIVPNGETVILGGNRVASNNDANNGIPGVARVPVVGQALGGVNNTDSVRENVLLMQARIIPAARNETLIAEAL